MKTVIKLNLVIFTLGFLASSALAQFAPVIPSRFLAGDSAINLSTGDQVTPEIASSGTTYLAVWQDKRALGVNLPVPSFEFESSSDIYAMRFDANGVPLDLVPIIVTQEAGHQQRPQVVWNGTNWLVLFESVDLAGFGFSADNSLEAVRVSPAGVVLDPTPIKIRNVHPAGFSWTAASDGNNWVVAFQESDRSSALDLLRVTAAGLVLQGPKVVVPSTYFLRSNLRLAYASGVFLFTWAEFSDTKALRFDSNLTVLDPAPFTLVSGHVVTDLTSSGTQFYAVWFQPVAFVDQVAGSRVSTAGAVLDGGGSGVVISASNSKPDAFTPAFVTWDGTNFRVSWSSASKLFTSRVSASGTVLDPGGVLIAGAMSGPTASVGDGGLHVAWSVLQNNEFDLLSAHVSAANVGGPNLPTGTGSPAQTRGDVALGTNGSMIVFRSDVSGSFRIKAQPLDANGNPLTAEPILLESGPVVNGPSAPSVAWNGSLYLVTWGKATGIVSQRINQNGTLVDSAPVPVMPGFGPTDVSAMGSTFLVIARQLVNNNVQVIIPVVARIDGNTGTVLDPAGIQVGNSFCISVSVATVGNRWLPVFRSNTNHDNPFGSTYGNFVNADGTTGTAFVIYGSSGSLGNGILEVAVASDGIKALALQSVQLTTSSETDLVGVIVNPDGTHAPAVNLTPWSGNQYSPRAAWDGSRYIVVFNDQVNRFAPFTIDAFDARSDLFGMRVSADGSKVDPMGFVFSSSAGPESWPSVSAANGQTLITGSILLPAPYDSYRIGYDFFGTGGNQWPIAVASVDKKSGDTPLTVNFSSAGSTDLDGTIVSYLWDFGDGSTSTAANPSHTYTTPAKYVATLLVTDNLGAKTTNTVALDVRAPNIPPVSIFTFSPKSGPPPLSITLVADGSYDPDGAVGNLEWHFSDGGTYFGSPAFHTFSQAGTYTIQLIVYDDRGATGSSTQTIVVGTATPPPAPTNLTAVVQSKVINGNLKMRIKLGWTDNATTESGYVVERCTGAGCTNFASIASLAPNTVNYYDKSVSGGTTYRYRTAATSSSGQSGYSNIAEATTP